MMELSGLNEYIDLIISNEDVNRSKPDPEMYITAMKKFNVEPNETVILEDNEHGIEAAIASGGNLFKLLPHKFAHPTIVRLVGNVK